MSSELLQRCYPGRRAELKRHILAVALECFNRQGIEATTIEQIREGSGASVGALYHHFGNKEGIVVALVFAAMDDQSALRDQYMAEAKTAEEGVTALIGSYLDWVDANPQWASYQYQARYAVSTSQAATELKERNRSRNRALKHWLSAPERAEVFSHVPPELLLVLIVGPAESYCRAWLSGRVKGRPSAYRDWLAKAAWLSLTGD